MENPSSKTRQEKVIDFTVRAIFNFISEFLGTAAFMFVGCLSCVKGLGQPGDITGISLSFSFALMVGIEIGLHISGGHVNPILTVASMFFKKVSIPMGIFYILGQFCGSLVGFGLVKAITPDKFFSDMYPNGLCSTVPNSELPLTQAVFMEFITSSILILVVCSQWDPRNKWYEAITLKIGFTVFCLVYATIHYTGCSMNPARTFGPAVWNNTWKDHWIYWLSPFAATFIWSPIYVKIFVEMQPKENSKPKEDE